MTQRQVNAVHKRVTRLQAQMVRALRPLNTRINKLDDVNRKKVATLARKLERKMAPLVKKEAAVQARFAKRINAELRKLG